MSHTTKCGGHDQEILVCSSDALLTSFAGCREGQVIYLSLSQRRVSMKKIMLSVIAVMCLVGFSSLSFAEDMGSMKGEMKGMKDEMKGEMKSDMKGMGMKDEMKGEMKEKMKAKHDEMKGQMKEMKGMKDEMKGEMGK
jgi:hypothetical protein